MSDKVEDPKKCEVHNVFLIPSKSNPNRLVCQDCINERIAKMVITRSKNKRARDKGVKPVENVNKKIELDFTGHEDLMKTIVASAKTNFRSEDQEILFLVNSYINQK